MHKGARFFTFQKLRNFVILHKHLRCHHLSSFISSVINESRPISSFDKMVVKRRAQAEKTVAIQVNCTAEIGMTPPSVLRTLEICQKFGTLSKVICTGHAQPNGKNLVVVQFKEKEMVEDLLKSCVFECNNGDLPVHSRFLYHSTNKGPRKDIGYEIYNPPNEDDIMNDLINCNDVSHQMVRLFDLERLGEFDSRIRFLACQEIEDSVKGLFPAVRALPFGSTLNGFGKYDCDLDMFLEFRSETRKGEKTFYFQSKKFPLEGRARTQQTLQLFGDLLQNFSPNVSQVNRIIHARVPIIKFKHNCLGLECDISITNMSGYYMSELLWVYGKLNDSLCPLVFAVRKWASSAGLTSQIAGEWITNFSLSLMVIFFLQYKGILPPLCQLKESSGENDVRIAAEVDCSFLRHIKNTASTKEPPDLETLLKEFFEFYESYDFKRNAISIISGKPELKLFVSPLFIVNPFESELNVSRNVSVKQLSSLQNAVKHALGVLNSNTGVTPGAAWGILTLFPANGNLLLKRKKTTSARFQINDVLDKDEPPVLNSKRKRKKKNVEGTTKSKIPAESAFLQKLNKASEKHLKKINFKLVNAVTGLGLKSNTAPKWEKW